MSSLKSNSKEKITKITGIVIDPTESSQIPSTYLKVNWKKHRETWEPVSNLNCRNSILDFMKKIKRSSEDLKNRKKENEQKKIDDDLKQTLIKNAMKMKEKNENIRKQKLEDDLQKNKTMNDKKQYFNKDYERDQDSKYKKIRITNRSNEMTEPSQNQSNIPFKQKDKLIDYQNKKPISKIFQNLKDACKSNTKRNNYPFGEKYPRQVPKEEFKIDFRGKERYFSEQKQVSEFIETKKVVEIKKTESIVPNPPSTNVKLFLDDENIGVLSEAIEINDSTNFNQNTVKLTGSLRNIDLEVLIFSARQNKKLNEIKVYRTEFASRCNYFYMYINEMKMGEYCMVDYTSEKYITMFVYANDYFLIDIYGDYSHLLVQIDKNHFIPQLEFDPLIYKTYETKEYNWHKTIYKHDFYTESHVIFQYSDFKFKNGSFYDILGDKESLFLTELDDFMKLNGHKRVSFDNLCLNHLFISEDYVQYIQTIPNLIKMKRRKIKFYVFGLKTPKTGKFNSIYQIFPEGGVLTISPTLFKNLLEVKNLNKVMKNLENKNGSWVCAIPKHIYEEIESFINLMEESLVSNQLKEYLKFFEECVDDYVCNNLEDYLAYLETKYYRKKRHFFILNEEDVFENRKSPTSILEIMNPSFQNM